MLAETENNVQNEEIDIEKQPPFKKAPMIKDWVFRLILFIIGLFGLDAITIVISLVVGISNRGYLDPSSDLFVQGNAFINTIRYLILFAGFIFLLFPRLKVIAKKFLNFETDLIGIIMGVILIGSSALYSMIINNFVDLGVNQNEIVAEKMIQNFPLISVVILGMIGPVCEEITYRYGLFDCISKKSKILAYIASILVFAIIHFDFTGNMVIELLNLPSYIIAGLVLTFTYHKFGFNASIIAHVLNNLFVIKSM